MNIRDYIINSRLVWVDDKGRLTPEAQRTLLVLGDGLNVVEGLKDLEVYSPTLSDVSEIRDEARGARAIAEAARLGLADVATSSRIEAAVSETVASLESTIAARIADLSGRFSDLEFQVTMVLGPLQSQTSQLLSIGSDLGTALSLATTNAADIALLQSASIFTIKASDDTRTSTVARSDDSELVFSAEASSLYRIDAWLLYSAEAAEDLAFEIGAPSGSTGYFMFNTGYTGSTPQVISAAATAAGSGAANFNTARATGYVKTDVTAGDVAIKWAQGTSGGVGTILRTGSWLAASKG